jgi:hypothetical protein
VIGRHSSSSNSKVKGSQLNPISIQGTGDDVTDSRSMRPTDLSLINANENLTEFQKESLIDLLMRYVYYMTSKPGFLIRLYCIPVQTDILWFSEFLICICKSFEISAGP